VQPQLTKRTEGMEDLNYQERLPKLRLYSQERRYMVILISKIAMSLVDGYVMEFTGQGSRRGRDSHVTEIVRNSPACVRRARETVKGARNLTSDKVGPNKLQIRADKILKEIPGQPTIAKEERAAQSNCLIHQIPLARANKTN